ncbi:uncharacterized protein LOC110820285 isoform X2 [Carica papaya]|uniref:uncharacterized protein LOC110820285 isoform X2 n=1 Tax=Carica papaya TaxID=3649 RepID=UPI000B8CCB0A|nr:uncharacterized protein LOC110820285 isoform X2 [Carica papaya]
MLPTAIVVTGFILLNKRRTGEILPNIKQLQEVWEVRALLLLSLTLQIVLIILGNRRKYKQGSFIMIVVWFTYLVADSIATFALGVVSQNIGDMIKDVNHVKSKVEVTSFWAPFLLLHLGGPDTITAYSLEDNELWLRRLLDLVVQTGTALYVFFMVWTTGSHLTLVTALVILAAAVKYGERIWVLRKASNEKLKEFVPPRHLDEEFTEKFTTGFYKAKEKLGFNNDVEGPEQITISKENELFLAFEVFKTSMRLVTEGVHSMCDQAINGGLFLHIPFENTFRVIEIELGFMYDILYTKAILLRSPWGIFLRILSFSLMCISLVLFSVFRHHNYFKIDLSITYILLAAAIFLEIYAAVLQVCSDQAITWLIKHSRSSSARVISSFLLSTTPECRWSNAMPQYNLLSFLLREKPIKFQRIMKLLRVENMLENSKYTIEKPVTDDFKKWIFQHLRDMYYDQTKRSISLSSSRGSFALKKLLPDAIVRWSTTDLLFEQSVISWHIATEFSYALDRSFFTNPASNNIPEDILHRWKVGKRISRYMMYLLRVKPQMFPASTSINLQETCDIASQFLEKYFNAQKGEIDPTKRGKRRQFSKQLLTEELGFTHTPKSLLNHSVLLTQQLRGSSMKYIERSRNSGEEVAHEQFTNATKLTDGEFAESLLVKWETICQVWAEILAYAAINCRGTQHLQQLTKGI